jgi:hypothetical protein
MTLHKLGKVKKLLRDPFVLLIAAVVLVPALLVAYGAAHQNRPTASINTVETVQTDNSQVASQSTATTGTQQQPMTQAEQPVVEEKAPQQAPVAPAPVVPSAPVCNEAKRQEAQSTRAPQVDQENRHHERQKDKIRVISVVYRKYWDEEAARHQNVLNQIESTYKAALSAANC